MNVTLQTLPPARVAYLRYTGPYGPEIGTFWRETVAPWMIENNLLNRVRYGIGHDDPSTTPAQYCRYDACVEVPADFEPKYPFAVTHLPGGRYAVAHFKGPASEIPAAWGELCGQWMPQSGLAYDQRPGFERYPVEASYDENSGLLEMDMCIAGGVRNFVFGHNMSKRCMYANQEETRVARAAENPERAARAIH